MVRIVNGVVVRDESLKNKGPRLAQTPKKPNYQLFPTTTDKLGILAKKVSLFGFECEIIWILFLAFIYYYTRSYIWLIVFTFLLWLYYRNSLQGLKNSNVIRMTDYREQQG
ncbi:unnamed protein product [Blepharisma stoltei]|uniref:SAYSvFN domain-containing protein n=1 Tax=Blepharisma stoltei TaxID=1481888 RepID=A0AAU9JD01_9CILI|nr:unnamed protein product [Blepharisma stoltei]